MWWPNTNISRGRRPLLGRAHCGPRPFRSARSPALSFRGGIHPNRSSGSPPAYFISISFRRSQVFRRILPVYISKGSADVRRFDRFRIPEIHDCSWRPHWIPAGNAVHSGREATKKAWLFQAFMWWIEIFYGRGLLHIYQLVGVGASNS